MPRIVKYILVAILVLFVTYFTYMILAEVMKPNIKVEDVDSQIYFPYPFSRRAKVTVYLANHGGNGYATVHVYIAECGKWLCTEEHDSKDVRIFVPGGRRATVQVDLDVPDWGEWKAWAIVVGQEKTP